MDDEIELIYDPNEPGKLLFNGREYRGSPEEGFWRTEQPAATEFGASWKPGPYVPPEENERG